MLRGWRDHGKPGQLKKPPERSGRMVLLESGGQTRAQDPGLLGKTPPLMGQDEEEQRRRQRYGDQRGERNTGEVLGFERRGTRCSKRCCYCFFYLRRIGITAIPLDSARGTTGGLFVE